MFQLRDEHLNALASVSRDNFVERGVSHLRVSLPDYSAPYTDDQLRERIRECVGRAGGYGLTSERQVMAFVDTTYIKGRNFDQDPELLGDFLADPTQRTVLDRARGGGFPAKAVAYLRVNFPEATANSSDAELLAKVREGEKRARQYGLSTESSIMGFVDLQWRVSPTFDTDPETAWSKVTLEDERLNAEYKIAHVRNAMSLYVALR
jgi:hypothetical protein